ncbi:Ldh family oxidoreductase [Mariluticola halotolerans]|uniref:Ldh family oxidoreductase n=1 Tax=Mariluticola halotolerans TaxID=2909283 RepID=UPI0026E2F6CE|nr:Ldh family oxidoreductase [Mariluticola halotolerans]UJQ94732.1 Ldh family oxidoreductase [Mariluticola halotolerans]
MNITAAQALSLATRLLEDKGVMHAHARLQAELLVEAELRGHPSHGLQRLPRLLLRLERGLAVPNISGAQQWTGPAFLSVDGDAGLGPVVAYAAIEALVARVEQTGVAVAGVRDANHLGMLALYAESIARRGLIGIVLTSSEALVHPYGGDRAMLGTNPIAIGIPTSAEPYVLDMATSIVSMGKIHAHALKGEPIPQGWALDSRGAPTTDAEKAKLGSIAPFGGAKGYGLGLGFELLIASLAGVPPAPSVRGTLDADHRANKGDVFIVIKPGGGETAAVISQYLDAVRNSNARDEGGVAIPGDGSRQRRQHAISAGFEVEPRLWEELVAAGSHIPASVRKPDHEYV